MPCLLIVDNRIHPEIYDPVAHWTAALDVPIVVRVCRPPAGDVPASLDGTSHVLVTGSEASITAADPWIERTCDLVRRAASIGLPLLGSCFGHQLLVRALSGIEHVRRSPTPEFGWVEVTPTAAAAEDPVASVLPAPFWAFSAHFDEVAPRAEGWETLASTPRCAHAVVRRTGRPVWGVQHHPEIGIDEGRRLIEGEIRVMPQSCEVILAAYQREPRDSLVTPALLRAFLRTSPGA